MSRPAVLIYSPNAHWRARVEETEDGVSVAFDQLRGVVGYYGTDMVLDPADLPEGCIWKQETTCVITDAPFHVVCDRVSDVLANMGTPLDIAAD